MTLSPVQYLWSLSRLQKTNKVQNPPINWWNTVCQREKKDWVENHGTCWNGSLKLAMVSGKGDLWHAGPNGNSLLIDHFQLKADLQVCIERFHQELGFQNVRGKWKNVCSHPSWWIRSYVVSFLSKRKWPPWFNAWACPWVGSIPQITVTWGIHMWLLMKITMVLTGMCIIKWRYSGVFFGWVQVWERNRWIVKTRQCFCYR